MLWFFLFLFGVIFGSFLNVVALRYNGDRFLFDPKEIGGRSRCPHCRTTLQWFELVPILSFIIQRGKCRTCKVRIGFQYPLVELLSGLIFLFVPLRLISLGAGAGTGAALDGQFWILAAFWIAALEALLLISYVDIRLGIIPDELNVFLVVLGIFFAIFLKESPEIWANRALGALLGVGFFGLLVLGTRGKGMGMGDVKLALPLGFLFGWQNMILLTALAFVIGAVIGVGALIVHKKTMKGSLPFGPFLAIAAMIAFFYGPEIISTYLRVLGHG